MKILWVTNNINQVGGVERIICGLSNYFVKQGHEVSILSINTSESKLFFELMPEISIKHCGIDWRTQTRRKLFQTIKEVLSGSDADLVIGCDSGINLHLILLKKYFSGKVLITQHNHSSFFTWKRLLLHCLFYRFADRFFVLTEADKRFYDKWKISNCRVMPNAYLGELPERSELKSHTIIGVGRLTQVKQFDHLIRAFSMTRSEFPDWKLKIMGDGEELTSLKELSQILNLGQSVELTGFRKDVIEQMQEAELFVLSSKNEGFSLVTLEAMVCGLPIISYSIPAVREVLAEESGMIVAANDESALADAMKMLMRDEKLRKEYAEKAYQRSKEYSIEKIGQAWLKEAAFLLS